MSWLDKKAATKRDLLSLMSHLAYEILLGPDMVAPVLEDWNSVSCLQTHTNAFLNSPFHTDASKN